MKTDYIDYIIPFHRSQIKTKDFGKLDIQGNDDFTVIQLEKIKDPKTGRWRNPRNAEERKLIPSVDDWWDYDATAEQNARNYLKLCHERGIKPKFIGSIGSKAKGTQKNVNLAYETDDASVIYSETLPIREGYYKLLVDFRRYDNSGKAIRQQPVVPNFNVNVIKEMLDAYKYEGSPTDANYKNDAVQEIVDEFISKFGDKKPTEADILGYKGEYNELTSIRNYNEDATEDVERLYGVRESRKMDAEYMDAYWDGDDDRMQELVDEAAYKAGYKYKAYHHTENGFTVFDLDKARKNMDIQGFYFFADAEEGNEYGSVTYDTYLKMENPYIVDSREKQNAIPFDMSKDNAGVTAREWLQEQGYDSVIRKAEYFGAGADEYIVFDSSQIKSAEAMTFEDDEYGEGDIIPLSERFNEDNKDIRYSTKPGPMERDIENMDEEGYNRYGWAILNKDYEGEWLLTDEDVAIFHEIKRKVDFDAYRNIENEQMYFIGRKVVYSDGDKKDASFDAIVILHSGSNEFVADVQENFYENSKYLSIQDAYGIIREMFKNADIRLYTPQNVRKYWGAKNGGTLRGKSQTAFSKNKGQQR